MAFVLDASAALPWCFRDESNAETELLLSLASSGERIYVPAHWPAEILNGLTRAARRGRLDEASVDVFLTSLPAYDIIVDVRPIPEQWIASLQLIRQHRLSAYDAAYLSLAQHLKITLATFDAHLRAAASAAGVALVV